MRVFCLALLFSVIACSSTTNNPTGVQADRSIFQAFCQKYADCVPSVFAKLFPDQATCVEKKVAGLDPNGLDACNADQVKQCAADFSAQDCPWQDDGGVVLGDAGGTGWPQSCFTAAGSTCISSSRTTTTSTERRAWNTRRCTRGSV
jgi:hypothetical protein